MQTFKKVAFSSFLFLALLAIISAIIIEPMIQCGLYYYSDGSFRDSTAGDYQMLFIGDSDGLTAFKPDVFLSDTGIKSYNLCQEKNTWQSAFYLLKKEAKRNPVSHVIIQVGTDTFTRNYSEEHDEGNAVTFMRTNNIFERIGFLFENVSLNGMLNIYSNALTHGILCIKRNVSGDYDSNFISEYYGWHKVAPKDITITPEKAKATFETEHIDSDLNADRIDEFTEILQYLKQNNIEATVVIVPMSDSYVWKKSGCDALNKKISDLCSNNGVKFFDFNLYKERFEIFSDKSSFKDSIHMSPEGAYSFTHALSGILSDVENGKDTENLFYDSYDAMKKDSPYYKYIAS